MKSLLRRDRFIIHWLIFCLFLTSCTIRPTQFVSALKPTEKKTLPAVLAPAETQIMTLSPILTPTAPVTFTVIPTSEIPAPPPPLVDVHTRLSELPPGQYVVYWSFTENACRLMAASMTQTVYDMLDTDCGSGVNPNQYTILSNNALFLAIPYGKDTYLYHLQDQRQEVLAPSSREDCTITSVSRDGMKFAGLCGEPKKKDALGVRTIHGDWIIIDAFPDEVEDAYGAYWSPDGKQLALVVDDPYQSLGVYVIDVELCLEDPTTCSTERKGPYWNNVTDYILWSPDGKQLAVALSYSILVYDIDNYQSKDLVNIDDVNKMIHGAAWSSDGKWIAYAVDKGKNQLGVDINLFSLNSNSTPFLTDQEVGQVTGWLDIAP